MVKTKNANTSPANGVNGGQAAIVQRAKRAERRRLRRMRGRQNQMQREGVGVTAEAMEMLGKSVMNSSGVHSSRAGETIGRSSYYGVVPRSLRVGRPGNSNKALLKALSPALEIGSFKWPDNNTADTVVMQNEEAVNLPPVSGLSATDTWSANIYITPFPDVPLLITRWKDGTDIPSVNAPVANKVKLIQPTDTDWSAYYHMLYSNPYNAEGSYPGDWMQTCRINGRSLTLDLVATATESKGTIYAAQNGIDVQPMPLSANTVAKMTMSHLARAFAGALTNDGEDPLKVMAKKLAEFSVTDESLMLSYADGGDQVDAVRAPGPPIDESGFFEVMQKLPDDFIELVELDKKRTQWEAKHGVYIPLKLTASSKMTLEPTSKQYHLEALKPIPTGTVAGRWGHHVMHGDSWQMGFVMVRNLHASASLNLKTISVLEGTPLPGGMMAKFAQPAEIPDVVGIQRCATIMAKLPSAHYSSANGLGTILNSIGAALADSGIPILSTVGRLTQTGIGKKLTGMLENL